MSSVAQPDPDAGGAQSEAKAKEIVVSMEQADGEQRAGLIDVHAAAMEKRRLRREMLIGPIAHMAEVGRRASREKHELKTTFRFKPGRDTYVALQTAGPRNAGRGSDAQGDAREVWSVGAGVDAVR